MKNLQDESTKQVITEQALELATDLFIEELHRKATPNQIERLLVILEEIQLNDSPAVELMHTNKICA